jgi:hypothetical protein
VAAGERGFDKRLFADQPVESGLEFAGGDAAEVEDLAQGMAGGGGRGCSIRGPVSWAAISLLGRSARRANTIGNSPVSLADGLPEDA